MEWRPSLVPSPSHPSFHLAAVEKKRFFSTAARQKLEWEGRPGNKASGDQEQG